MFLLLLKEVLLFDNIDKNCGYLLTESVDSINKFDKSLGNLCVYFVFYFEI